MNLNPIMILRSIREKMTGHCRYSKTCSEYLPYGETCNHGAGDYCGVYRKSRELSEIT